MKSAPASSLPHAAWQALARTCGTAVRRALALVSSPNREPTRSGQASKPELQSTLKDNTRGATGDGQRHFARAGLVLAEVSISLVLLVGAGLLFRSLMTLVDMPMSIAGEKIVMHMDIVITGVNKPVDIPSVGL